MSDTSTTILVRVSGPDGPGITAGLMTVLADAGASVQDVEQVVVRNRLTLGLVVTVPSGRDVLKELLLFGWEHGVEVDFEVVDDHPVERPPAHVVTALAADLGPRQLAGVTGAIADHGGNIDRIVRLSRYPVLSFEMEVIGGDVDAMRAALGRVARDLNVDVALQRAGLGRRAKRLVVMDLDSTLIQNEVIDLLADEAGCADEVGRITERAMQGELDFEESLRSRVALLEGLDELALRRVLHRIEYTAGARTFVRTLQRLGYRVGVISGGFTQFTDVIRDELRLDHAAANTLEIVDGRVTGRLVGPVVDRAGKADLLRRMAEDEGIPLEQTVAIGDGANDVDMLATAGLGVAFNAKPAVREAADTTLNVPFLDAILFLLGVSRGEIEAADAADPPARPTPRDVPG